MGMNGDRSLSLGVKSALISFCLFFFAFVCAQLVVIWKAMDEDTSFLQASARSHLTGASSLLEQNKIAEACEYLEEGYKQYLVGFYVVQRGSNAFCVAPQEKYDDLVGDFSVLNRRVSAGDFIFEAREVNRNTLVVGSLNNTANTRLLFIKKNAQKLIFIPLVLFISISIAGWLIQIPFRKIQDRLKSGKGFTKNVDDGLLARLTRSQESSLVAAAADASESHLLRLKSEIKIVEKTIGKSIFEEIKRNGENTPYTFKATFLRYDVNNYTQAYLANPDSVQAIIQDIASISSEIVSRYEGLHYDFAGDEFVLVFKDTPGIDSKAMAIAAARDIFDKLDKTYPNQVISSKVTMKGSLYHGDSTLYQIDFGFYFRGESLIYTQRLLTIVDQKERNTFIVSALNSNDLHALADFDEQSTYDLKGLGSTTLRAVKSFTHVTKILASGDVSNLKYFRSDGDILLCLSNILHLRDYETRRSIIEHLKSFTVSEANLDLASPWINALNGLDKEGDGNHRLVSSLLIAGNRLIPKIQWSSEKSKIVGNLVSLKDSRVASAALIFLSEKASLIDFNGIEKEILRNYKGESFRPIGDSLIARSKQQLSHENLKTMLKMLKSENFLEVATGVYACSNVIRYYRKENPIQLSQFTEVDDLLRQIKILSDSSNEMVRARAAIELKELGVVL